MKKSIIFYFSFLFTLCSGLYLSAQKPMVKDFSIGIHNYSMVPLWMASEFYIEDDTDDEKYQELYTRPEILGFIGDDFQRFQIHFQEITRDSLLLYRYYGEGKIKVNDYVQDFRSTFTVEDAKIYQNNGSSPYIHGYVETEVIIFQNPDGQDSGVIQGLLTTQFVIDETGIIRYDATEFMADSYSNNQFVGYWTNYRTKEVLKCHWGDFRIPQSGDLDIGAGEFSVNEKYINHGWGTYLNETQTNTVVNPWWKEEE